MSKRDFNSRRKIRDESESSDSESDFSVESESSDSNESSSSEEDNSFEVVIELSDEETLKKPSAKDSKAQSNSNDLSCSSKMTPVQRSPCKNKDSSSVK